MQRLQNEDHEEQQDEDFSHNPGQSYKNFTLVNYNSRVVLTSKLPLEY